MRDYVYIVKLPAAGWVVQYQPAGEQPLPAVTCQNLRLACDKAMIALAITSKVRCVVEAGGQSTRINRQIVKSLAENYHLWWDYNQYGYKLIALTAFHECGSSTTRVLTSALKKDVANVIHNLLVEIGANIDTHSLAHSVYEYNRNRVYNDKEAMTRYQILLAQHTE